MSSIKKDVFRVFKKPFCIGFAALISLVVSAVEFYLIFPILFGISAFKGGNVFESYISLIQFVLNFTLHTNNVVKFSIASVGILVLSTIALGFILSGYLPMIKNALHRNPEGSFFTAVKQHFVKITFVTLRVTIYSTAFIVFMMIATVPAAIITRSVTAGKYELTPVAVLLDLLTVLVLFLGFMFFRTYMFFWYPARLDNKRKAFRFAKQIVDANFFKLMRRFIVFDIMLFGFECILIYLNYFLMVYEAHTAVQLLILFIGNWIFKTFFLAYFITYVFASYKGYSQEKEKTV